MNYLFRLILIDGYNQSIKIWAEVKKIIEWEMKELFLANNHVFNLKDNYYKNCVPL